MTFRCVMFTLALIIILLKVPELLGVNDWNSNFGKEWELGYFVV